MPHFFLTAARALNTSGHVRVIFAEGPALSFLLKIRGTMPDGNPKEVKDRTCQALALALSLELAGCVGVGLKQRQHHRSHFGSRYKSGCCGHACLFFCRRFLPHVLSRWRDLTRPGAICERKAGSTLRSSRAVPHPVLTGPCAA